MKRFLSVFIVLFIIVSTSFAQNQPSFIKDSLDHYVEYALKQWQIPGVAVLVVKDGNVVVLKGYGVKELGKQENVDENTLFMIGSNTKAFTGTALAILEYEGKLKLEDKIIKYLPDFKMKDP
jgi:CubicO group peptidase (beta-lactamase class C family)